MPTVELFQAIEAEPQLVYTYLATADGLSAWHADEVRGSVAEGAFTMRWPSLGAELSLRVLRAVPEREVVLAAGQSTVTITVEEGGVRLIHAGLEASDDLVGFRSSWALALALLAHAIEAHAGEARKVTWAFETAVLSPELAHFYFSSALGLRSWLGVTKEDLGEVGSRVALRLSSGTQLSGRIIAHEKGRDLAISWIELGDAVLVLRTLPAANKERTLSISLSSWDGREHPEEIKALNTALKRLRETLKGVGKS